MRKHARFGFRGCALMLAVAGSASPLRAQESPKPAKDAAKYSIVPLLSTGVREVLQKLAASHGVNIIADEDVRGTLSTNFLLPLSLEQNLDLVCNTANLTWAKVEKDTYLVVNRRAPRGEIFVPFDPFAKPLPQWPAPDWEPFEFNGMNVYVVPLHPHAEK